MIPTDFEILAIPLFAIGVVFLWKGSDVLVDGTTKTAANMGVSTLIISVVLVGFGTSAPEFAISIGAAFQNNSDISLGNIIGSCIANLFLVLGIAAIIKPINIKRGIVKREAPLMLAATFALLVFAIFGLLDKFHITGGIFFIVLFSLFLLFFFCCAKKERKSLKEINTDDTAKNIFFIFIGIAGVVAGAWLLLESAICIAGFFGIPQIVIAISMVAIGTSLPELVVSSVASFKGESDIAVGNVLGSNVFNILLVLGFAAFFIPLNATESISHIIILVIFSILIFPIILTGKKISRIEGFFLLIMYSIFMWYTFFGSPFITL